MKKPVKSRRMGTKGTKQVGRKEGVKKAQAGMLQHDRKVRGEGSTGYSDKAAKGAATRLKDVPL
jgi:hypothetical protein